MDQTGVLLIRQPLFGNGIILQFRPTSKSPGEINKNRLCH